MRRSLLIGLGFLALIVAAGWWKWASIPPRDVTICGAHYHELSEHTFRPHVLTKQKTVRVPEDVLYVTGSCSHGAQVALGPRWSSFDTLGLSVLARDKQGNPTAIVTMDTGPTGQGLFVYQKGQRELFVGTP